jgi:hypothetical protein
MTDYISVAEVKASLPESGLSPTDATYDGVIGGIVTAISRLIDREVGRQDNYFAASSTATVRYYDGNGTSRLWIDDAVSVDEVAVSEVGSLTSSDYAVYAATDYIAWPYNDAPIRQIMIDRLNGTKSFFSSYRKNVRVTAVFGYSLTPPAAVKQAALIQATRLFMRTKQAYADTGASPEVGGMTINVGGRIPEPQLDNDVRIMLWPFKFANSVGNDD